MVSRIILRWYAITLVILLPIVIMNGIFMTRAGEFRTLSHIVALQVQNPECIYGSAVHEDTLWYKLAGYSLAKPDIAVFGSSRAMQLRSSFFRGSFYNLAGGQFASIPALEQIFSLILAHHRPRVAIVGFDYWWFLPVNAQDTAVIPPEKRFRFSLPSLFLPSVWIAQGKLSIQEYLTFIASGRPPLGRCAIGVLALFEGNGSASDGSSYNRRYSTPGSSFPASDIVRSSLEQARAGIGRFTRSTTADWRMFDRYIAILRSLRDKGVEVIVVVPPLAPDLWAYIQSDEHNTYIPQLFQKLEQSGFPIINAHNPASMHIHACNFMDGIHGDAIAFATILRESRLDAFRGLIDSGSLEAFLERTQENKRSTSQCDEKIADIVVRAQNR